MGKPTIRNGIVRAIKEIAIPSVTILLAVVYSRSTWDEVVAGIVFVVLTTVALGIIYKSLLCRIARQRRYDCVISVESEETEYCDFGVPSLHS